MKVKKRWLKYLEKNWREVLEKRWGYKYYTTIDFLPLFNFFKILETNDLRYLLKLKDYETLPNIHFELNKEWNDIQSQYEQADNSNNSIITFTQSKSLQKLHNEYLVLWNLNNLLLIAPEHEKTKEMLNYVGIKSNKVEKKLKVLRNKIEIKNKDFEKPHKKIDFMKIIDEIEDIKGREIDIYKTTVRKYIAIKQNIHGRQNKTEGHNRKFSRRD